MGNNQKNIDFAYLSAGNACYILNLMYRKQDATLLADLFAQTLFTI